MSDPVVTTALLLLCVSILISWDVYVAWFNRIPNDRDTISGQVLTLSERVVGLPFAFGALGGHFFWPGTPILPQPFAALAILGISIVLCLSALLGRPRWMAPVSLAAGMIAGHLLWPQS